MEAKFTKGDWTYRATSLTNKNGVFTPTSFTISKSDDTGFYGKVIASVKPKNGDGFDKVRYDLEEAEANAKLIAAAPELARHLKKCIEALELIGNETGQSMPLTVADAKKALQSAIN